jgi:transposase-like protein
MKKKTRGEDKCCPHCGNTTEQTKQGFTSAGSQRYKCHKCGKKYTPRPKTNAYSEEVRENAIKTYLTGISARKVGQRYGFSKANVLNWIKKRTR